MNTQTSHSKVKDDIMLLAEDTSGGIHPQSLVSYLLGYSEGAEETGSTSSRRTRAMAVPCACSLMNPITHLRTLSSPVPFLEPEDPFSPLTADSPSSSEEFTLLPWRVLRCLRERIAVGRERTAAPPASQGSQTYPPIRWCRDDPGEGLSEPIDAAKKKAAKKALFILTN